MIKKILFCLFPALYCSAATLHVDNSAKLDGDGSATHPFHTIQKAADIVNPGDTVVIYPGIYYETVRLRRFGKAERPVTFRADKIMKNRVIITGADPAIRRGESKWQLFDEATKTYVIDYAKPQAARILYSGTDMFPYQSLERLMTFEARPGVPGPRHGFFVDPKAKKLYVRLRPDGRYGSSNPNQHQMAVSPPPMSYGDEEKSDSQSYNFGLLGKAGQDIYVVIDGITFETPGHSAVYASGNNVVIRNCYFVGCRAGGVFGRVVNYPEHGMSEASCDIIVEFCEWHSFPVFDDVKELIELVSSGRIKLAPENQRFHYWIHKARANGTADSYETGIAKQIGRNWTIRNCYIHDCFEGLANLNYGENTIFEDNLFERCVDNAIETEDHAKNCHIRRNRFVDIFQAISWQPLRGEPWPGPIYIYQNLFSRTPGNNFWYDRWGGGGTFKIGAPFSQWDRSPYKETLANVNKNHVVIPAPGLLIFNNTIIDPSARLVCELGSAQQKLDNVSFYNNIAINTNVRHPRGAPGEGGVFHYRFVNNRFGWTVDVPFEIPALKDQICNSLEKVLPGWKNNSFIPAKFEPAVRVPDAPEQFKFIGALQHSDQRIADKVGVQEEPRN